MPCVCLCPCASRPEPQGPFSELPLPGLMQIVEQMRAVEGITEVTLGRQVRVTRLREAERPNLLRARASAGSRDERIVDRS